jgi:ligand-binding sensor domain-containing protein
MRLFTAILICCSFLVCGTAQTDSTKLPNLAIGHWEQHLPWQRSIYVSQSDQKVYFATDWAVLEVDKTDRSSRYITKVEGLSDVGMGLIRYSKPTGTLLMVYGNSNIDLYKPADKSVLNLPFIKKNYNIIGDKKIYDVTFENNFAYLACGFGILKLNLTQAQAEYTTFTNTAVKAIALFNGYLYAGTSAGLYRLAANDENPADFDRWELLGDTQGLPAGSGISALTASGSNLYIGIAKTLYRFDGNSATQIASDPNRRVSFLTSEGPGVVIGWTTDDKGIVQYIDASGNISQINYTCGVDYPLYAIEDGAKKFWFSDQNDLFPYYDMVANRCDLLKFNSPRNHKSSEIAIGGDGKTYVATPGPNATLAADYRRDGVYVYDEGNWSFWNLNTVPEFLDTEAVDLWRVIVHPTEDKQYIGSWVGGIFQFSGGKYAKKYTQHTSILQGAGQSGSNRTAIGGMAFDQSNNLWISNYNAGAPIAVLKADGTLRNFAAAPANGLLNVAIDQNGYKWFIIGFNGGILVYDSGQDLDSPTDDRYRIITSTNSALPTNTVNSIAVDLDGDVWVGTQQGVVSFECGSNVFDASCTGRRRIVNVDGFNGYLLETEDVRAIAVDGGNRKWFGTTNGVFVQSPDALTQVAYFKDTNSPLFDNAITDIAINNKSGEVWIGTEKGLISYRGEATTGGAVNSVNAYAYPNPVRPDYDGPIAIYGLGRDANVKITDVSGNLVYEGKALGGQAIWNARDYLGRRVASGVYVIYATSATLDSPDAVITKVVVLH